MAVTSISLSSIKNYTDDLTKEKFDSLNFVSFDGGELATVSGDSIYNIILGNNDTAGSLAYRISAAENDILELNNKLGDGFSDTSTVTQQFSTAKERITVAEENAQVAASTLDNFLTVADGKDFLFLLDDLTVPVGRLDKLADGSYMLSKTKITNWNIHLPLLKTGSYMFESCPLMRWDISLPLLENGGYMFHNCNVLTDFNGELLSLKNGDSMFLNCARLINFTVPLSNLTIGRYMFYGSYSLINFKSDLSSLINGEDMFHYAKFTTWDIELPLLSNGNFMYASTSLTQYNISLPSIIDAKGMFLACNDLESFTGDLSSLRYGFGYSYGMFQGCSKLINFVSNLSSLLDGDKMFSQCKLSLASVQNIADTINDLTAQSKTGKITIGMQASLRYDDTLTDEEQPDAVAAKNAIAAIVAKGWTVTEQYNS